MEKDRMKKVALLVLPIAFLLFISFCYALEIIAEVSVITGAINIEIQSPENCTDYPTCDPEEYYHKKFVPLEFTVDTEISYAGYNLDSESEVDVTDKTSYNGTHTVGDASLEDLEDGFHNITVIADTESSDTVLFYYCYADVNEDKKVRIDDILIVALAFGSEPGNPKWEPEADINCDNKIRIDDILAVALEFGYDCPQE